MGTLSTINLFVSAHPDDCLLFMQPSLSNSLGSGDTKTIILAITAGDAGRGDTYWKARESGLINAIQSKANYKHENSVQEQLVKYNNISVQQINIGVKTLLYFLRIPDGNIIGSGFTANNNKCLKSLFNGDVVKALDNNASYCGVSSISSTIKYLIKTQWNKEELIIHSPCILEPDGYRHSDHEYSAKLINQCFPNCKKYRYLHYSINNKETILTGFDLFWKINMYSIYESTIYNKVRYSNFKTESMDDYINWCFKSEVIEE